MKKLIQPALFITCLLLFFQAANAGGIPGEKNENDKKVKDTFPVPTGANQLFYVQRTPNANTIVYEVNFDSNGTPVEDEPIHVFWIRYTEGGIKKDLNYIQRHFAYGVQSQALADGRYKINFVAYKKRNLYLAYAPRDNKYHIYCNINNKTAILSRIYIHIEPGGTFWSPNVRYLELKGIEMATGQELIEKVMIE